MWRGPLYECHPERPSVGREGSATNVRTSLAVAHTPMLAEGHEEKPFASSVPPCELYAVAFLFFANHMNTGIPARITIVPPIESALFCTKLK